MNVRIQRTDKTGGLGWWLPIDPLAPFAFGEAFSYLAYGVGALLVLGVVIRLRGK